MEGKNDGRQMDGKTEGWKDRRMKDQRVKWRNSKSGLNGEKAEWE